VYVPPDYFGDAEEGFTPLRLNAGQVLKTDGTVLNDCILYYERTPVGIHLRDKGKMSFTWAAVHDDSLTQDTLYRIDMTLGPKERTPQEVGYATDDLANYYLGSISAEQVKAYRRAVYEETWDSTDVHFYSGGTGPRMAIVIKPGGDPAAAKLSFSGQDSLKVDWQGALKIYLADKWIKLEQAVAYQVNGNNQIVPVNWTADYLVEPGNVSVGFEYENYNPAWPLILQIGYPPSPLGGGPAQRNLTWSTYAGGHGGDELECVEVDGTGNPYACGYATGVYFPIAVGFTVHTPFVSNPTGWYSAVIMKVDAASKITQWATYYGGYSGGKWAARTKAHKLALDPTVQTNVRHVFVTGSTNCTDFYVDNPDQAFDNAVVEPYGGGLVRMWVGAFDQLNGILAWATTHGQIGDATWREHGLAIAVDPEGQLVVGGQIETFDIWNPPTPNFPLVTPAGAFSRPVGGGFFIVFDEDYQIEWATTFGELDPDDAHTKVTDMRIERANDPPRKLLWLTGTSSSGTAVALDTQPSGNAFYQANANGHSAMIASIDINTNRQVEYCTRWGNWDTEAYGLHLTAKAIWVVGYTSDLDLTSAQCPDPGGPGVHHSALPAGTTFGQGADGFVLRFLRVPLTLQYGSLIGGLRDDILLDVNSYDDTRVFITGETRSAEGFSDDINGNYYFQPQHDYWNRRDALILSLADNNQPAVLWRSAFGGTQSDRGWGIAASSTEVHLVGSTASQQTEGFPLWDYDPNSILDLYQDWNLGGNTSATPMVPFYQFSGAMDHEYTLFGWPEANTTPHDGFIASFGSQLPVEVPHVTADSPTRLVVTAVPLHQDGLWRVPLPDEGVWTMEVFDATGRRIRKAMRARSSYVLQLQSEAVGIYVVRATSEAGLVLFCKVARP